MEKKSEGTLLLEKLAYEKKNAFETASEEKRAKAYAFAEGYKAFLDAAKTEREAVKEATRMAQAAGFTEYRFGDALKAGDKKYFNVHNKSFAAFVVGSEDAEKEGFRLLASHID